jgi:quinolinate synthase
VKEIGMKLTYNLNEIATRLSLTMLPHEVDEALSLIERIQVLKKERNAVVLGHNYMSPAVFYGVSDYIGDSLGLSRRAAQVDADVILFNGVHFMAETAKILNPEKVVLIADPEAGCSLAESITRADVQELKRRYPGVPVVTYVNCSAEVKAETDICCTSANAVQVVNSVDCDSVIFLPDAYLAKNVALATSKKIISWPQGKCMVHELFKGEDIRAARAQFGNVIVIAHPECDTEVTAEADFTGSTSQMEEYIRTSSSKTVLLITECSMGANLKSVFPDRDFVGTCNLCPHMKKITLEKVVHALETLSVAVEVPEEIATLGRRAVERMIALG